MDIEKLKRKIAFILALTIPLNLSGCKSNNSKDSNDSNIFLEDIKNLSEEEKNKFLRQIAEILPIYNIEDVVLTTEELAFILKAVESDKNCTNKSLNSEELASLIITNSLDENNLILILDTLEMNQKEQISEVIKQAIKLVINKMVNKGDISLEDACVLKDVKIVIGTLKSGSCMGFNNKEKIIIIDYQKFVLIYENIENKELRNNLIKEGIIRYLECGINELRLQACDCRIEAGQKFSDIGYGENLEFLKRMAISSGSNESLGEINKVVFNNLAKEDSLAPSLLLLLAVFKENRNIEDLYKVMFDSDLKGLYSFFGLKTTEEIKEFYTIAKVIEMLDNNEYKASTEVVNIKDFYDFVGYAYKISIFKTCVSDLINYIAVHKDLNMREAMFLYKYVKSIVVNNVYTYDCEYVKNILAIENIYFEFLSKFYGLELDKVDELYEIYYYFGFVEKGGESNEINYDKLLNRFPLLSFIEKNYSYHQDSIYTFDTEIKNK